MVLFLSPQAKPIGPRAPPRCAASDANRKLELADFFATLKETVRLQQRVWGDYDRAREQERPHGRRSPTRSQSHAR